MGKEDIIYVHTHIYIHIHRVEYYSAPMFILHCMAYCSAIKENEILPFEATWIGLEIIILSEVSQTEKDKYPMISLICRI